LHATHARARVASMDLADIDAEEKNALVALEAEFEDKRHSLRRSFEERRKSYEARRSASQCEPEEIRTAIHTVLPSSASTPAPDPAPVATPTPPPAGPATSMNSSGARMTLWEREQLDAQSLEQQRAERIAALDSVREKEADEARRRQEEWRVQDEARHAAEEARRAEQVAEMAATKRAAEERGRAEKEALDGAMVAEQQRLALEQQRQVDMARKKAEAMVAPKSNVDEYAYDFEEGMEKKIKTFRQRGNGGDAFIIKIDHENNTLRIEEEFKKLESVEALAEQLDEVEPRYLLYIHTLRHSDGRVQYPIAFIVFLPESMPAHLKVMYTRPVVDLAESTFKVPKHIMLEEPEDLTSECLEKQLEVQKK